MGLELWIEITGWIGMLLVLCGRGGIAYKQRWGFLSVITGGFLIGTQAFLMGNSSIVALAIILLIIDFQGWLYWGKKSE